MIEIYKDLTVKPVNPIIMDIGCSVGKESDKLMEAFPDFKLLYSIDPFYECIDAVNAKITERNMQDKWFVNCCAIDSKEGDTWVKYGPLDEMDGYPSCGLPMASAGNVVDLNNIQANNRLIKTKRIEQIHPNPDILKIDIEGYEWYIWEYLLSLESVKVIFLELHGKTDINLTEKLKVAKDRGFTLKCYEHTALHTPANIRDIGTYGCQNGEYCQVTFERGF